MQEEGDDGRLQGDGVTAGGAEGRLGRHATAPLHSSLCTPNTSLVHRHGLNMRVKVSSAVPTFGPGPMMLLCRPPPPELLATRTNFVSGAVLVLQPSQSNITAV